MTLPPRSAVVHEHTWNRESVFATPDGWQKELEAVKGVLAEVKKYPGHLGDSPDVLADWLELVHETENRVTVLYLYATMEQSVDTTNQDAAAMMSQVRSLQGEAQAASAFAEPEILSLRREKLDGWMKQHKRLALYAHYFDDLFRLEKYTRSGEVEAVLGLLADPFGNVTTTYGLLNNADLPFEPARTGSDEELPVAQSTITTLMSNPDREIRRTSYEHYNQGYLTFKNTFASLLATSVKQDVFMAKVRGFDSALEASLYQNNIPRSVYDNLIETYKNNLPTWHRYWRVRRKALGYDTLRPYDFWAPLTNQPHVTFEQAVNWISEGMQPLGEAYVSAVRKGCLEDRWVDIYPNQGKRAGAFSFGAHGTHPFIFMSFANTLQSMSTLAHELGHSMHSYLSRQHQPIVYGRYTLFAAEVASNFNQAMTRAYLLQHNPDPQFQIAVIEEAMSNFLRYFFIMPTLARFELEVHTWAEKGKGLTADAMIKLMAELFAEGYGGEVDFDHDSVGITWAQFGHLYSAFYVYQYATGISAAHALADGILTGKTSAVDNYLKFLSAGGSLYPIDALKMAGVDMSQPEAVTRTFEILASYVDRLEDLTAR